MHRSSTPPSSWAKQAERVLDAGDLRGLDRHVDLGERRRGDADAGDLALVAQRHHLRELIRERHPLLVGQSCSGIRRRFTAPSCSTPSERRLSSTPARSSAGVCAGCQPPASSRARADLGHEDEVVGVRVQRLADQLVGDVRAVVLGGVDVVDAGVDGPAQHGDRLVVVARWTHHAGTGQLHRAEADAPDRSAGDLVRPRRHHEPRNAGVRFSTNADAASR